MNNNKNVFFNEAVDLCDWTTALYYVNSINNDKDNDDEDNNDVLLATMAELYHYNEMFKECLEILKTKEQISSSQSILNYSESLCCLIVKSNVNMIQIDARVCIVYSQWGFLSLFV